MWSLGRIDRCVTWRCQDFATLKGISPPTNPSFSEGERFTGGWPPNLYLAPKNHLAAPWRRQSSHLPGAIAYSRTTCRQQMAEGEGWGLSRCRRPIFWGAGAQVRWSVHPKVPPLDPRYSQDHPCAGAVLVPPRVRPTRCRGTVYLHSST